ncbi:MAG: hypothetical protein AAF958_11270 [Planctomycetota bacterium]
MVFMVAMGVAGTLLTAPIAAADGPADRTLRQWLVDATDAIQSGTPASRIASAKSRDVAAISKLGIAPEAEVKANTIIGNATVTTIATPIALQRDDLEAEDAAAEDAAAEGDDLDDDLDDFEDESEDDSDDQGLVSRLPGSGRFSIPPLAAPSLEGPFTDAQGRPETDEELGDVVLTPLSESRAISAGWATTTRLWAAPNTWSHPRYFEDRMLERHGHERWGYVQPLAAGVRFYSQAAMLGYLTALRHPCDCEYTLGYYRSGNCVPAYYQRPPWDRQAFWHAGLKSAASFAILP